MNILPFEDRLLVKRKVQRLESNLGILIPDSVEETATCEGEIVRVGTESSGKLKAGQKILFEEFTGRELELDDEKYIILSEESVIAILED